jgi:hypothetical protein
MYVSLKSLWYHTALVAMPAARLLQSWALAQCSAFLHSLGWYYSSDQTAPPILDCKHPENLDHHLPPMLPCRLIKLGIATPSSHGLDSIKRFIASNGNAKKEFAFLVLVVVIVNP